MPGGDEVVEVENTGAPVYFLLAENFLHFFDKKSHKKLHISHPNKLNSFNLSPVSRNENKTNSEIWKALKSIFSARRSFPRETNSFLQSAELLLSFLRSKLERATLRKLSFAVTLNSALRFSAKSGC